MDPTDDNREPAERSCHGPASQYRACDRTTSPAIRCLVTGQLVVERYNDLLSGLRPALLRRARAELRNDAWAEDAVSETLLAALQKPSPYAESQRAVGWVYGVLKHKMSDQLRTHLREDEWQEEDNDCQEQHALQTAGPGPEDRYGDRALLDQVTDCLDDMPRQQANVLLLSDWLGCSTRESTGRLCMSPNHFYVTLHRARQRLKAKLGHDDR